MLLVTIVDVSAALAHERELAEERIRRLSDHCVRLQSVIDAQDEMIGRLVDRLAALS
jgi:hypothetical protein